MTTIPGREKKTEVKYPCKTVIYPDGYYEDMVCSAPVFGRTGWEAPFGNEKPTEAPQRAHKGAEREACIDTQSSRQSEQRALRRASANIRRLTHCAPMRYFVTLTLDPAKIDRYDPVLIVRKMGQWASDRVKREGLAYVLVAERHKDGAIHFHGFFNDALEVVDSGTISRPGHKKPCKPRSQRQRAAWMQEGGKVVYNLPSWKLGFSTAIELYGDLDAAISYTCKYLTKDLQRGGKVGGRWYYHGGQFAEPEIIYHDAITLWDALEDPEKSYHVFPIPEAGLMFALRRGRIDG